MDSRIVRGVLLVACAAAFAAKAADGQPGIPKPAGMTDDTYYDLLETGGRIERANTGYGLVQILNRQSRVEPKALERAIELIRNDVSVRFVIVTAPTNAQITVEVVDDAASARPLAVYPDELRSVVNVAPLAADGPDAAKLSERLVKETIRAFAYVGGITGGGKGTLMDVMTGLDRLDQAVLGIPGDYVMRCNGFLRRAGVKPYFVTTYRNACEEGWAPNPSDVWQKAIWDEIHQKPTKGLKIKYDPKKGE